MVLSNIASVWSYQHGAYTWCYKPGALLAVKMGKCPKHFMVSPSRAGLAADRAFCLSAESWGSAPLPACTSEAPTGAGFHILGCINRR